MRVLQAVAALLGRVFERLGRVLLSWSGALGASPETWGSGAEDGAPEHWIRYVRQRAPWLVRRHAAQRSTPRISPQPAQLTRPAPTSSRGKPQATRTLLYRTDARGIRPPAQGRLESRQQSAYDQPESTSSSPTADVAPRQTPRSLPGPMTVSVRPDRREVISPKPDRITPTASHPGPVCAPTSGALARPALAQPALEESVRATEAVQARRSDSAFPEPDYWPAGFGDGLVEQRPPLPRDDVPIPFETISALTPKSEPRVSGIPAPPETLRSGIRPRPPSQMHILEDDRWPELPDAGWRGETWAIPSNRSLVREQRRLDRLKAEQAGFSWSEPHS